MRLRHRRGLSREQLRIIRRYTARPLAARFGSRSEPANERKIWRAR